MTLSSLRPRQPTDLARLSRLIRLKTAREAALPSSLPEEFLLAVARDLRSMDFDPDTDGDRATIAAPLMLVFYLLFGTKKSKQGDGKFAISERALYDSLQVYQWAVEREIVTRITGIEPTGDKETLLTRLEELSSA